MELYCDVVKKFYTDHEQFLTGMYPGLRPERLTTELFTFMRTLNAAEAVETDQELFIQTAHHPARAFFKKVEEGVPLQYISGRAAFRHSDYLVNSSVLIPRPETELLVDLALNEAASFREPLNVVDVGTGSGAIILSFMQEIARPVRAWATDTSPEALKVARRNFFRLRYSIHPESKLDFLRLDRLFGFGETVNMIITNPPYLKKGQGIHPQVVQYEPHEALFLDDEIYRHWFSLFFDQAYKILESNGIMLMEGNEEALIELKNIAEENGFNSVTIVRDYTDRDRFLVCRKNSRP
jgi:release factor glutamine methyltransferase